MQRLSVTIGVVLGWSLFVQPSTARDPVNWAAMSVPSDPPMQYTGDVSQRSLLDCIELCLRITRACTAECSYQLSVS